jgi:hypothetical protein
LRYPSPCRRFVAGIDEFLTVMQNADGRDKPGHDNYEDFA